MKKIFMKVSDDKFEFPEIIADSAEELARKCGVKTITIQSAISHYKSGILKHTCYRVVEVEDDPAEAEARRRHWKLLKEDKI